MQDTFWWIFLDNFEVHYYYAIILFKFEVVGHTYLCVCLSVTFIFLVKQESPLAWTQEAYRPPCSEYSFCCPILADRPCWTPPPASDLTPPQYWPPPLLTWPTPPCPPGYWPPLPPPAGLTWPPLPAGQTWPPPAGVDKLTKWNYYLPVVLRTRAVINSPFWESLTVFTLQYLEIILCYLT